MTPATHDLVAAGTIGPVIHNDSSLPPRKVRETRTRFVRPGDTVTSTVVSRIRYNGPSRG